MVMVHVCILWSHAAATQFAYSCSPGFLRKSDNTTITLFVKGLACETIQSYDCYTVLQSTASRSGISDTVLGISGNLLEKSSRGEGQNWDRIS